MADYWCSNDVLLAVSNAQGALANTMLFQGEQIRRESYFIICDAGNHKKCFSFHNKSLYSSNKNTISSLYISL